MRKSIHFVLSLLHAVVINVEVQDQKHAYVGFRIHLSITVTVGMTSVTYYILAGSIYDYLVLENMLARAQLWCKKYEVIQKV